MAKLNSEENRISIIEWAKQVLNGKIDINTIEAKKLIELKELSAKNKKEYERRDHEHSAYLGIPLNEAKKALANAKGLIQKEKKQSIFHKIRNLFFGKKSNIEKLSNLNEGVINIEKKYKSVVPEYYKTIAPLLKETQNVLSEVIKLMREKKQQSIFLKLKSWLFRKEFNNKTLSKLTTTIDLVNKRIKNTDIDYNEADKLQEYVVQQENKMFAIPDTSHLYEEILEKITNQVNGDYDPSFSKEETQRFKSSASLDINMSTDSLSLSPPPRNSEQNESVKSVNTTSAAKQTLPPLPDSQEKKEQTSKKNTEKRASKPTESTGNVNNLVNKFNKGFGTAQNKADRNRKEIPKNTKERSPSQPKPGIVKERIKALKEHRNLPKNRLSIRTKKNKGL